MKEIWLVRHTTPKIAKGIAYGQADLDVTEDYPNERDRIKHLLQGQYNTQTPVYTSPLKRCHLLATDLAATLGNELKVDDRLMEMNFGVWEQTAWNDIPQETLTPWMNDFVNYRVPEGECFLDVQARVVNFWEDLLQTNDEKVIVSTHSGVIRTLLCQVLDIPLKNAFRLDLHYGTISKLSHHKGLSKVVYFNH
ncbi:alpha-ribazole phosphatase [uncultured Microscilla sp.]|uniref:alpha-ribazole phosphatase n=1 Tax=uncultured Microscilla sp. TaxID=432653 RepID=UPI00260818F2|nr:alpha-ribazole phosphatase [uncultured Microscilla sp.]